MSSTLVFRTQRLLTSLLPYTRKTRKFKLADAHRICRRPIHLSPRDNCRDNEDEEFSSLSEEQLKQVYAGVYPTDFPREAIRLKSTRQEYSLLSGKFSNPESDKGKIKRLRFNRGLSATSILHRPTPIHESLIETTRKEFTDHLSSNVSMPLVMTSNSTFFIGADDSDTIEFVPDLAISSTSQRPFLVLEVGVSEKYDDMLETAKTVLSQSPTTKFSIIIKLIEKPLFRSPLKLSDYLFKPRSDIPIPSPPTIKDCYSSDTDPEGPIMINGLRWVGKISAFWEIWGRDATGNPVIKGQRVWFYGSDIDSPPLKLSLEELENCSEIVIESSTLARAISESRAELAVYRCHKFLRNWNEKRK
ncbi:hypothetical protein I7I53_08476 [Histoplasma capsulatum var. duboisii H88]|uniref:Uncharacterized protein n=1 Tax=Ajellomyces capsulatus (strain H88) TaxID=544711 RepID=A0A8A1LLN9_AJEC8|nr:hypothetical protein I7I53_08476 [Histoplasma capsulatum var. duboisii H88]